MIFGIGTDIIEVSRLEKLARKGKEGLRKIFSDAEIVYCESKKNKFENYAARFAAKEAFLKAFGTGWRGNLAFNEISIENDKLGKPFIVLSGDTLASVKRKKIKKIHVSLSHLKELANAVVVLEK